MPIMVTPSEEFAGRTFIDSPILLASDSDRHGKTMYRALREQGFPVEYAGDYGELGSVLQKRKFAVVLLEVTGEHAVEEAVAAALSVKRARAEQFVGYLADAHLETSGLAGDAVFPRNAVRLAEALRKSLREEQR